MDFLQVFLPAAASALVGVALAWRFGPRTFNVRTRLTAKDRRMIRRLLVAEYRSINES